MATKTASSGPIYVMKSSVFRKSRVDIPARIRKNIPWIVTTDATAGEVSKRLKETPMATLFVIADDGALLGVITTSGEVVVHCAKKKKGGGGGGGVPNPNSSARNCQADCDSGCAQRGGCGFIIYDPFGGATKCSWECNDRFQDQQDQTVGDLWF